MSRKSVEDNKNNTKDAPNSYYESLNNKEKFEADEKLCGLVEKHPQLYDKDHPSYRKAVIIDATWKAVAASWGDTADNSKKRWNTMRTGYKQALEKGKEYYLAKFMKFLKPYLNIVNGQTETETTADKNVVGDNKDLPQLTAGMRNMELNQKSETPKKTTQKPKTTTPKGGTSAVSAANEESETPKKTTQKPKTTTPKGGTSAVSAANEESETPKKNIQKPKTTTPKGGNGGGAVYNITTNNTP